MSFAKNFQMGMQIAGDAMDAFDQARLGKILSETKDAKVQELAPVEDVQAVPVEQIQKPEQQTADLSAPFASPDAPAMPPEPVASEPKRTQASPKQYQFLGKTYDQPLTDDQMKAARTDGLKGRISELFNPVRGLKQMRELELQDQEDFKFGLFKTKVAEEAEERNKQKKIEQVGIEALDASDFGQALKGHSQDLAAWQKESAERQAKIAAGTPEADLPAMRAKPVMPDISPVKMIASNLAIMSAQVAAGAKFDPEKFAAHAQAYQRLQEEGVGRALTAAADGAPIERVAELFNKSGKARFDATNVVADVTRTDANGAKSRVITYFDPEQKRNITIDTGAELAALGKAGEQMDKLYKISQINANNATIDLRKAQTDLYGAQLGATQALERQREAAADKTNAQIDGTLPGGTGRGGALQDARLKAFGASFEKFNNANDPVARADALRIGREALDRNPEIDPATIGYAAQAYVTGSAKNIQPQLDFNTGEAVAVFTDERTGKQVKLHSVKPSKEQEAAFKPQVQAYLQQQEALGRQLTGKPGLAEAMRRAAVNPKDAEALQTVEQTTAMQSVPTFHAELIRRWKIQNPREIARKNKPIPEPTQKDALEWAMRELQSSDGRARLRRRLDLIRAYGQ